MTFISEEDIIKEVIDEMRADRTGSILSVVNNGSNSWTINVDCTKDIVVGQYINVGATAVKVTAVSINISFTVKSSTSLTGSTTWSALAHYFFYGQPIDISAEIDRKEQQQHKNYPAVVLFEIKDIELPNIDSPIGSIPRVQMFFVDQYDPTSSVIETLYGNVVDRMHQLALEFIRKIRTRRLFYAQNENYSLAKWSRWNVQVVRNGKNGSEAIFNNHLAGVELNGNIPISKNANILCGNC